MSNKHADRAYPLSRNYEELYRLLCTGIDLIVFVGDEDFGDGRTARNRDICLVRRKSPFNVTMGVRGIAYGGLYPNMEKRDWVSEYDLFRQECERLNLDWVVPGAAIDVGETDPARPQLTEAGA